MESGSNSSTAEGNYKREVFGNLSHSFFIVEET